MLSPLEQELLSKGFNQSQVEFPSAATVVSLFEQQVLKTPANLAVVFEQEKLSFSQLNERANQLASQLIKDDSVVGRFIPICMERSADMLVAMLAIMKTGAAYVPIDIDFPAERISFMLNDLNAQFIVSSRRSSQRLKELFSSTINIIETDGNWKDVSDLASLNPAVRPAPNDHAYLIYTSGSTGQPKGVMITHRNLVDYVFGLNARTGIDKCHSYALVSTIATDLGNTVIFSSLLFGGALHIFSKETTGNAAALHRYFRLNSIDCLKIVPSHWQALNLDEKPLLPLKLVIFGGEALPAEVVEHIKLTGSACTIVNHYGPTETTIGKLLHVVDKEKVYNDTVPIGQPFSNTNVYVLDKAGQLVPDRSGW